LEPLAGLGYSVLTHVDEDHSNSSQILVVPEDQLDSMFLRNNLGSSKQLVIRQAKHTHTSWDEQRFGWTCKRTLEGSRVPSKPQCDEEAIHEEQHDIEKEEYHA
jgi:hypothetical protein